MKTTLSTRSPARTVGIAMAVALFAAIGVNAGPPNHPARRSPVNQKPKAPVESKVTSERVEEGKSVFSRRTGFNRLLHPARR